MQDILLAAGTRLHRYLLEKHWNGAALVGPDPGVRFNARAGRFIKGYLPGVSWTDEMIYMQTQGYWVFANWALSEINEGPYEGLAMSSTDTIAQSQRDDGAWDYPNPAWRGRVATVEGSFAALALLDSYRRRRERGFLDSALRWHTYLEERTGFRANGGVNYFAHEPSDQDTGGVPNNSTLVLWLLAQLAEATGDHSYLSRAPQLVSWLSEVQLPSGELPYKISPSGEVDAHFLCYNYNAFEFVDLLHYYELTGDDNMWPVLQRLAAYLQGGVTPSGTSRFECEKDHPIVLYYTPALARALSEATRLELGDYRPEVERLYGWLLEQQVSDGRFVFYSTKNYGWLSDTRSYPRYLAMVLHHLVKETTRL